MRKQEFRKHGFRKQGFRRWGKHTLGLYPRQRFQSQGIPKSGIPKTGIPKAGIPTLGIPKMGRFTAPLIQTPLRLPLIPGNNSIWSLRSASSLSDYSISRSWILKFRRVTIRGAQPSARLSEEICLSEGSAGVSQRALRGSLRGFCGVSAGFCRGPRDFPRVFGGSDSMLVTLGNCWTLKAIFALRS